MQTAQELFFFKEAQCFPVFFQSFKVFYQDNEVGEIVRNYAFECQNVNM